MLLLGMGDGYKILGFGPKLTSDESRKQRTTNITSYVFQFVVALILSRQPPYTHLLSFFHLVKRDMNIRFRDRVFSSLEELALPSEWGGVSFQF